LVVTYRKTSCYNDGRDRPHHRRRIDRFIVFAWWRRCAPPFNASFNNNNNNIGAQDALTLLRASFSSPKVLHLLRCSPSAYNPALQTFDSHLRSAISKITNSALSDIQWLQASMPIAHGGLGCEGCHRSQFLPFWLRRRAPFLFRTTSCHCVPVPLTHSLTSTYLSGPHWLVHYLIPYLENSYSGTNLVF